MELARKALKWDEPGEPAKVVGPIYSVGTKGLSVFLVKTTEGLIVINTPMPGSGPMVEAAIRKLGVDPKDIRLLLAGHAHSVSINPGYRLAKNPSYFGIEANFRRTLRALERLKPDIWLAPHTETYDFQGKRARSATEGVEAWVDPDGYRLRLISQRESLEATVDEELGIKPRPKP